jgi:CRP/FNR family cyclic AMP-dependent transcriptional regulator
MDSAPVVQPRESVEDPLSYLTCSQVLEYKRGEMIYNPGEPLCGLHLIISGRVKVCRLTGNGRQVVLDIYGRDQFFGESAILGVMNVREMAVALETTKVMKWTMREVEEIIAKRPRLSLALVQLLVQRLAELAERIETFSGYNLDAQLACALLHLSARFGEPAVGGWVRMFPLTHELLAQYIGTSREIVTNYMNEFRRQGILIHSRKAIELDRKALQQWLKDRPRTLRAAEFQDSDEEWSVETSDIPLPLPGYLHPSRPLAELSRVVE